MTGLVQAGAATVDVTPPAGLAMAGFAARDGAALGAHDPLTVRAVAVDDTAVVVADVIGLDDDLSARVRARAPFPDDNVVVAALHTHGGPALLRRGFFQPVDEAARARLEDACVAALAGAAAARRPARLLLGAGADPGIARNRRRPDGPVDPALPVLRIAGADGGWIAVVTAYACHPVVLGPDNRLWTADYPGVVRRALEAAHPGAVGLFLTGCCGDANHGHSAAASLSTAPDPNRTFAAADAIGARVAAAALAAEALPLAGGASARSMRVGLGFARREDAAPDALAALWDAEADAAPPGRAAILRIWARWARTTMKESPAPYAARVSVLDWGGAAIAALPGEIFAETALAVRARLAGFAAPAFVLAYAEGCPGYIPPASEFAAGGYEVDEAHRYYDRPATFAPGSAERLADAVAVLAEGLREGARGGRNPG